MCPKPKIPKAQPIAQTPPPAAPAASQDQTGPKTPDEVSPEAAAIRAKRRGRSGLRIPLDANTGGGATGINVPQQ